MVWREDEPTRVGLSQAELVIALPTDVLELPSPWSDDEAWRNMSVAADGWHMPLDMAAGRLYAEFERDEARGGGFQLFLPPDEAAELDVARRAWQSADAATVMRLGLEEVREREQAARDQPAPRPKGDRSTR